MAVWVAALLADRPSAVTWAAALGVVSGGAALACAPIVVDAAFSSDGSWGAVAAVVAVVQVAAAVLLIVGGARLAAGAGRRALLAGIVSQFLTCAAYGVYAVTVVAGDPHESPATASMFVIVAGTFAALAACSLFLATRPAVTAYLARGNSVSRRLAIG